MFTLFSAENVLISNKSSNFASEGMTFKRNRDEKEI